ncbi:MAG: HAMP domain-containing histidine kinase, partial [Acidimicrobiia bacterium]|nr:HAMP domain-containing histidine kinase [Acidimicrobiia bacterium]
TLSLAEAGPLALHPEPTDLADLVGDAADAHRRIADAQGVVVDVQAPPLPGMLIDPVRIREVIANLVVNALNAMPDGGSLRLRVEDQGSSALITVSDTGVGLTDDEVEWVFDRFHKGSTSKGTGLGLTISRDLVEAHGGIISMDSEPGAGTTVSVALPKLLVD